MKRLNVIASFIKPCDKFADIGCDHGLVSLFVAKNRLANKIYACDVSPACLDKARKLLADYDAEFVEGDGFTPLQDRGIFVDQAVIAGMGGELIIRILSACRGKPALVLGAQKNADKLRSYLTANGYVIVDDVKTEEKGKFYDVIRAEEGKSVSLDEIQLEMGVFYKTRNPDLLAYCEFSERRLKNYKRTEENEKKARFVAEVKKWQL